MIKQALLVFKYSIAGRLFAFCWGLCLPILLISCATPEAVQTDEVYFQRGMNELRNQNYQSTIQEFEKLTRYYAQSPYARQAYLELLFAYYKSANYPELETTADKFLTYFSDDPRADYAAFMRAVALYQQSFNRFDPYLFTDLDLRDFTTAEQSYKAFVDLINNYPDSAYVPNARQHVLYVRNRLAAREVAVGYYYLNAKNYLAAVNRGQFVLKNYVSTPSTLSALHLIAEAYAQAGFMKEAAMAQEQLNTARNNNPDLNPIQIPSPYIHESIEIQFLTPPVNLLPPSELSLPDEMDSKQEPVPLP